MGKFSFSIDRGGTFTDVYVRKPDGSDEVLKLLSEDSHYPDAPTEGIRRILESELNTKLPRGQPIDSQHIESIRMGTTVATNALLERKGEKVALAITKGFPDLLYIGNQSRPHLFDLKIDIPEVLYEEVIEVDERIVLYREDCEIPNKNFDFDNTELGEKIEIWKRVNEVELKIQLEAIFNKGIDSLAVLLLHSFKYPNHELIVERLAKEVGFKNISLSSKVMPMIKAVPRGYTAAADAYLTPVIQRYVMSFLTGFKNMDSRKLMFMQSDGSMAPVNSFFGSRAILSGPAGGVVGVAATAHQAAAGAPPLIGYDMGGTSTDVCRYHGRFEHVFETTTAGITIQAPQLDINTVAAGGGSKLFFRDGLFVVGPDSVGANPGPLCYNKGGALAVTDANLALGRILPEYFPKIFGPNENESLDSASTRRLFERLTMEINDFLGKLPESGGKIMSVEQVAQGFVDVANESMCRPIKALTQAKGYDTSKHVLTCFGGAGGQHACAIAKLLGIKKVFVHRYASILSAYGISLADVVHEAQEPLQMPYEKDNYTLFNSKFESLSEQCASKLTKDGFDRLNMYFEYYLNMRYDRTDCALMCQPSNNSEEVKRIPKLGDFLQSFQDNYKREFGFVIPDRKIIVDDIRVRAIAKSQIAKKHFSPEIINEIPKSVKIVDCYFKNASLATNLYELGKLQYGHTVKGPALITEVNSTIVIEPDCSACVTKDGNVEITINLVNQRDQTEPDYVDPIQLSIFSHRFMSIAEQMGRVLQRTAISTNIKERLDFSCALFSEDGGLVANAPHIPVHLGSMQETVKFQMEFRKRDLKFGDVILCNDPNAGGTHLPDLTVITPVFYKNSVSPQFFVANRGHHADIGGIVPGSMPPHSVRLDQEGACIKSFKIVENGRFDEEGVTELLMAPSKVPDCSGARNLPDNISDLRAQIAANQKGVNLMMELIEAYGLSIVQKYMNHIQANADVTVREMLKNYGRKAQIESGDSKLTFSDYMDDGTLIQLTVTIDIEKGEAIFDFTGTGCEVYGSTNAPKAVAQAALIYCLRCLVGRDIPLNQGCLKPVTLVLPENSLINPSPPAAVVGGNVLTSQRLVDVILGAFGVCAASQGCMNNVTFGDQSSGYYETVAGGAGAGPGYNGRSGIHTHMTNTRITDPEILEHRYPVVLKKFHLRKNSGGSGRWSGGDGVVREFLFRKNLTLSVLCERRAFAPYGIRGGKNGKRGLNLLKFASGRTVSLGGKASIPVSPGDIFVLKTPGGGGWESEDSVSKENPPADQNVLLKTSGSLHMYKQYQESA